jgi:hypothetical protein
VRVLLALVALAGVAAAAEPPLVVFHAPAGAPEDVAAARESLAQVARAEGTTLVDLSARAPAAPTAPASLRRAIEAYEALRYDEALQALGAGLAEAETTGAAGLSPNELSDLLLYRALVQTQRGDTVRAWEDFVRAATVDPTRRLDPLRFPPRTVESFSRAVSQVVGSQRGALVVSNVADECRVLVDARTVAGHEASSLPLGEHFLRVDCPGAEPFGAVVALSRATQPVTADIRTTAAPTEQQVLELARARGAATVLYATVGLGGAAGPTMSLRLLGKARGQSYASLPEAAAAMRALIAGVVRPPRLPIVPVAPIERERERRWYEEPWLWAAGGVAGTVAVVGIFLLFEQGEPNGATVRLDGEVP